MVAPVISIDQGKIRGKVAYDYRGGRYYSFQGIPYAKPPLGKLRFKAPQPPEKWDGVRDATTEGCDSFSRNMMTHIIGGSEDCLFINVYTPKLPKTTKNDCLKPVMFWICGGSFTRESSKTEIYGPDFLITEGVVIVTFNYRVGVLGFLSIQDPSLGVPGNAGLKDVVFALKWVQKNIRQFNGDANNVTIFGESAGAVIVHYLLLSPMTKDLFHKAVAQSGCALCPWSKGRYHIFELAKALDYQEKDEKTILQYLMSLPVEKLFTAQEKLGFKLDLLNVRPVGPVIEKTNLEPAFLSENPIDIIEAGKFHDVPFIIGYTSREGMLFDQICRDETGKLILSTDFEEYLPYSLNISRGSSLSHVIADKIKDFYYGNEHPTLNNLDRWYLIYTDNMFFRPIHTTIRSHLKSSSAPIYFYRFSVESNLQFYKKFSKVKLPGVCHTDELGYLFKNRLTPEVQPHSVEELTVRRMTKLWGTFARYGDPNPKEKDPLIPITWQPVEKDKHHYIDIGENLTIGINPDAQRMAFWDQIYQLRKTVSKM